MNFFITGVSHGLGKELTNHYLQLGHKVFGLSSSNIKNDDEISGDILKSENFKFFNGSVNNETEIFNAIKSAFEFMGSIDVLINNAGYKIFKLPDEITDEEYRDAVNTNLLSPILICKKIVPEFIKQKSGHIINMASNAGMISYKLGSAYCSSKAGLISYTLSLADYLMYKNVTANVISPPTFSTVDYRREFPELNHDKLIRSEKVIKLIDYIIFNKKFITGKNFPMFRLKTFVKFVVKRNLEFLNYLFQP